MRKVDIECPKCHGEGKLYKDMQRLSTCVLCRGRRTIPGEPRPLRCQSCHNQGCSHCNKIGFVADWANVVDAVKDAMNLRREEDLREILNTVDDLKQATELEPELRSFRELEQCIEDANEMHNQVMLEERYRKAVLSLKSAFKNEQASVIDHEVTELKKIQDRITSRSIYTEIKDWIRDGSESLQEMENKWIAEHHHKQSKAFEKLAAIYEKARGLQELATTFGDEDLNAMSQLRQELSSCRDLMKLRFLPRFPPYESSELLDQAEASEILMKELEWRREALSKQEKMSSACAAAIRASGDKARTQTRENIRGLVRLSKEHLRKAPIETETAQVATKWAEEALRKGQKLLLELDTIHEKDLRDREDCRPRWIPDGECTHCQKCFKRFVPLWRHKHHCRQCGSLICDKCSTARKPLPELRYFAPERVCVDCKDVDIEFEEPEFPEHLREHLPTAAPHKTSEAGACGLSQ